MRQRTLGRLLLTLVVITSLVPDIGIKFATFGFHWTAYRLTMFIALILSLCMHSGKVAIIRKSHTGRMTVLMGVWIVYGLILLVSSPYSVQHSGLIELLSILNGFFLFMSINALGIKEGYVHLIDKIVIWVVNILLFVALFEIVTGKHLAASSFNNSASSAYGYANIHMATGFSYNINDFSAMLSCLFPVVFIADNTKKKWITLAGIVVVNLINDATTCNLAIIVSVGFLYIINSNVGSRWRLIRRMLVWIALLLICIFLVYGQSYLFNRSGILGALSRQIFYARRGSGSLYARLTIYKDAIIAWINSGMLGMGPSSFSNYFSQKVSLSGLVNPHSLALEILFQYGIIIFAWYAILLFKMFSGAYRIYKRKDVQENKKKYSMVMMIIIVYAIASFAPSTFLGYAYQWLLVAMCCMRLDLAK